MTFFVPVVLPVYMDCIFFSKNYLFSFEIGIDCSVPKLAYGAHGLLIFQVLGIVTLACVLN